MIFVFYIRATGYYRDGQKKVPPPQHSGALSDEHWGASDGREHSDRGYYHQLAAAAQGAIIFFFGI